MRDLKKALTIIKANPSDAYFAGPRSPELIAKAEGALGIEFPPTYREFLLKIGCGSIAGCEFFGITNDNFENASVPNGIWLTLEERRSNALPPHLTIIYALGEGTYYALDASQRSRDGECPVVALPLGFKTEDKLEVVARDFGEFLLTTVVEAMEM